MKSTLLALLSSTLIGIPAVAIPAPPVSMQLGSVLQAERARSGAEITAGATLYDGDRLETQDDGTLRAQFGKTQIYLRPSTLAEVHRLPNGYSAELFRGTVIVSSPKGQTFQLLTNGATIRTIGTQATVARVTWLNPYELLLTSNLGAIQVSFEGGVKTIEAGNSYRMEIQSEDSVPPPSEERHRRQQYRGHGRVRYVWIIGASAATAIGIWRVLVSPCGP